MLTILDRYMMKAFIKNLVIGILGSIVIFFSLDFFAIIREVTSGNLAWAEVPVLAINTIPRIISYDMMHMAALIGSLITMSALTSSLEIVALKTSGVRFRRIVMAPLILAFTLSLSLMLFTEFVSVYSSKNAKSMWRKLRGTVISKIKTNKYFRSDNKFYRLGRIDGYANSVRDFQMVTVDGIDVKTIFNAKKGNFDKENKKWTFTNVIINNIVEDNIETHDTYELDMKETPSDFLRFEFDKIELTLHEIQENIHFLEASGGDPQRLVTHVYHQRFAYPFSILIMTIIGLALVSRFSRAGTSHAVTMGILVGFAYYIVVEIAKAMGLGRVWPMLLTAWLPNLIFLLIGIYYFIKAEE